MKNKQKIKYPPPPQRKYCGGFDVGKQKLQSAVLCSGGISPLLNH